jgi:molecular chaperone GrpE
MSEPNESAADRAIREALESVERLEREAKEGKDGKQEAAAEEPVEIISSDEPAAPESPAAPKKKSASDVMLESVLKAKGELQEVLSQTQKEAKDLFDRLARVSADFDNFKKRQAREKQDAIKFANESVIKEMLPVLDNLQRALAAAGDGGSFVEGVRLVCKQFEDVLGKFGVTGFDSLGEPFDPAKHEAVGARNDATVPAQHVCEEYQRGYMLHDRLLRPALVIVSSGPAPDAASA